MKKLDAQLLDIHQRTADWFQDWTGKDCFYLARWCLWLATLADAVSIAMHFHKDPKVDSAVVSAACVAFQFISLYGWSWLIQHNMKPGYMNEEATNTGYRAMLLGFLTWAVIVQFVSDDIWLVERIFICSWSYFVACTPRPPKAKTKLKELVEKLTIEPEPLPNAA